MTTLKTHYSCAELAEMKLPGLPTTKRNMLEVANREGWIGQKRTGRGGGYEYQPPAKIMALIKEQLLKTMVQTTPTLPAIIKQSTDLTAKPINPGSLKDWQREIAQARSAICMEVKRLATVSGTEKAIQTVIDLAGREGLLPQLQRLVPIANAKAGTGRMLSRTTLYRWLKELPDSNMPVSNVARLAPKTRETAKIWAKWIGVRCARMRITHPLPMRPVLPNSSRCQASRYLSCRLRSMRCGSTGRANLKSKQTARL